MSSRENGIVRCRTLPRHVRRRKKLTTDHTEKRGSTRKLSCCLTSNTIPCWSVFSVSSVVGSWPSRQILSRQAAREIDPDPAPDCAQDVAGHDPESGPD